MAIEDVKKAFWRLWITYRADRHWYLRRIPQIDFETWRNEFAGGDRLPSGYAGFINLIGVLLLMRESRQNNQIIDETRRNRYNNWNQYFRENFLSTFPDIVNYQRMYESAKEFGICDRLFPKHGNNRFPIATVLAYSGYFYIRLLNENVNLQNLSDYCQTTVEDLQAKKAKLDQLRNESDLTPEEIAEELQIPEFIANQLFQAFAHDEARPRLCRRNGRLVYLLPREITWTGATADELLYRFAYGQETAPTRVRYRRVGNRYRHGAGFESLDLANCTEIVVIRKQNGVQEYETKDLKPLYVFEGNSENPKKNDLRSNTQYSCLKSGLCPKAAQIVVEGPEGGSAVFNGQELPAGGKLLLTENGKTLLAFDVNSGNEVGFFSFSSIPVHYVSQRDIPCFSAFPEFDIDADNATVEINGTPEDQIDDISTLYGEITITVRCGNSVRKKRCRVLPRDLTVAIKVGDQETSIDPDEIEQEQTFETVADIVFRSEHLAGREFTFHLPAMTTNVECTLTLDNGCEIPIKFEIPRQPGAYVSIQDRKIALVEQPALNSHARRRIGVRKSFDWDDFMNSGKLHISRAPNQLFAVFLRGGQRLRGARCKTLTLGYADLCEMVDYNETELLNITSIDVIFLDGNNRKRFSIDCFSSSLQEVSINKNPNDLILTFPYARTLEHRALFLVLKKVEEQAAGNILILPKEMNAERFARNEDLYCISNSLRCMIQRGFIPGRRGQIPAVQITVPGFYAQVQNEFPAQAYLGFVLKPGRNENSFLRCTQGFFVNTNWSPENEAEYFGKLMCGKEFLDNRTPKNIERLEAKFRSSDEQVCNFIDRFLRFCEFSHAQSFMDVCFHSVSDVTRELEKILRDITPLLAECFRAERNDRYGCIPSGYIFLAARYWLEKQSQGLPTDELMTFWDPELFPIETIRSVMEDGEANGIDGDYKENWTSFYKTYCDKNNQNYGPSISRDDAEKEIDRITREKFFANEREILVLGGCRTLRIYASLLYLWRKQPSLCYPSTKVFYILRYVLQTLRNEYPLCHRFVAEQAWKLEECGNLSEDKIQNYIDNQDYLEQL